MKMNDALREVMDSTNMTQTRMANNLTQRGKPATQQVIAERLKMKNISVNLVLDMLAELGYEMTIQPQRTSGARPKGQIVISSGEGDGK